MAEGQLVGGGGKPSVEPVWKPAAPSRADFFPAYDFGSAHYRKNSAITGLSYGARCALPNAGDIDGAEH